MGFFGRGKEGDVIDLGEHYRKKREAQKKQQATEQSTEGKEDLGFLGNFTTINVEQNTSEDVESLDVAGNVNEKKKRFAKRMIEMTNKLEDISNQIYHITQRLDVLERKSGIIRD